MEETSYQLKDVIAQATKLCDVKNGSDFFKLVIQESGRTWLPSIHNIVRDINFSVVDPSLKYALLDVLAEQFGELSGLVVDIDVYVNELEGEPCVELVQLLGTLIEDCTIDINGERSRCLMSFFNGLDLWSDVHFRLLNACLSKNRKFVSVASRALKLHRTRSSFEADCCRRLCQMY